MSAAMEGFDVCGNVTVDSVPWVQLGYDPMTASTHSLKNVEKRFETFSLWPPGMPVEPKVLADAGLIYTGLKRPRG